MLGMYTSLSTCSVGLCIAVHDVCACNADFQHACGGPGCRNCYMLAGDIPVNSPLCIPRGCMHVAICPLVLCHFELLHAWCIALIFHELVYSVSMLALRGTRHA